MLFSVSPPQRCEAADGNLRRSQAGSSRWLDQAAHRIEQYAAATGILLFQFLTVEAIAGTLFFVKSAQ